MTFLRKVNGLTDQDVKGLKNELMKDLLAEAKQCEPAKQAKPFLKKEISEFISNAYRSSSLFLQAAIAIVGIYGCMRKCELHGLKRSSISVSFEDGEEIIIGELFRRKDIGRPTSVKFAITDAFSVGLIRKFIQMHDDAIADGKATIESPLFRKIDNNWNLSKCVIGVNTISKVPYMIAQFLKLPDPECYTGHSFRRTSACVLANEGGTLLEVQALGGWRSPTVAQHYITVIIFMLLINILK